MSILTGCIKLSKFRAIEYNFFKQLRQFKDGISFFEFNINFDQFQDEHNPKVETMLVILNCKIFEISCYRIPQVCERCMGMGFIGMNAGHRCDDCGGTGVKEEFL